AGCSGYILKDAGPTELHAALMATLRSESPVPRRMIPDVLRRVAESAPVSNPTKVTLTSREMEVLRAVAKGHTTKRISKDLDLARTTVSGRNLRGQGGLWTWCACSSVCCVATAGSG